MLSKTVHMILRHNRLDMLLNRMVGVDYKDSPSANLTSVHGLMIMAAQCDLDFHQMEVKTVFCMFKLQTIYIEQP